MIKQDNRPQQDSFNTKIDFLNDLLNDNASDNSPAPQETEKITFISVNGNNNIITTEKSRCSPRLYERKIPLVVGAVLFLLFF